MKNKYFNSIDTEYKDENFEVKGEKNEKRKKVETYQNYIKPLMSWDILFILNDS